MVLGKRILENAWTKTHCLLFVVLACHLVLTGCADDDQACPVCPDDVVGTQIVPYISYFDEENHDLICAKRIGDSWGVKIVDSDRSGGRYTSIALDAQNNAHISYHDDANLDLMYAVETENDWLIEFVDQDGNTGQRTSIALDAQGIPHISYWKATGNVIRYASRRGGAWKPEDVVGGGPVPFGGECLSGDWGGTTSLVVDAGGIPHISYYSGDRGGCLAYAVKSSASSTDWLFNIVDESGNVGNGSSMALDAKGNPHISYCEYANNVRYAWMDDDGEWHQPEIVPGVTSSGRSYPTSLALDTDGNPHIVYYTSTGHLAYAMKNAPGGWLLEIVDDFGDVGADCSIALDSEGEPHISYWDVSNNDLKCAVKSNRYWIIDTVDPWGSKGKYTSIAIGSQ